MTATDAYKNHLQSEIISITGNPVTMSFKSPDTWNDLYNFNASKKEINEEL